MDICANKTFTGEDISAAMKQIATENKPFFDLLEEFGQVTLTAITSRPIDADDVNELILSCMLAKTMNTFEAVIRLCRAGFVAEAKALARVLLESVVIIKFIEKDPANLKRYLNASKHERVRRLRNIIDHPEYLKGLIEENDLVRLGQLRQELTQKIKANKIAKKNIGEWAKEADMFEAYIIAYDLLSEDVHIDPYALDRYIIKDENEKVIKIDVRSVDLEDLRHMLFFSFDLFTKGLIAYCNMNQLEQKGIEELLQKRSKFGPMLI